jgi:hypothetical protein
MQQRPHWLDYDPVAFAVLGYRYGYDCTVRIDHLNLAPEPATRVQWGTRGATLIVGPIVPASGRIGVSPYGKQTQQHFVVPSGPSGGGETYSAASSAL